MRGRGILMAIVVAVVAYGVDAQVRLKPDTTYGGRARVRLKPDTTYGAGAQVRLKPDTTYSTGAQRLRRKPDTKRRAAAQKSATGGATRQAILVAEDRRAPDAHDLAIIRAGLRSQDADTIRIAVRALGRLERPELIADIASSLKSPLPEVRAEAANAIGQAAQGWKALPPPRTAAVRRTAGLTPPGAPTVDAVADLIAGRLRVEGEGGVRAALCDTLGRLPYTEAPQVARAERALLEHAGRNASMSDRLGAAQGLDGLARLHRKLAPLGTDASALLVELLTPRPNEAASGARIRRLAADAVLASAPLDSAVVRKAAADPDPQVRRLAMRAAGSPELGDVAFDLLRAGLADAAAMVRIEAVRGLPARMGDATCAALVAALKDRDTHVALVALDGLARCGASEEGVAALEHTVNDLSQAGSVRGWHRGAHAIVALAAAAPDRANRSLGQFAGSRVWQLRTYAARAATLLEDRATLETLAADADDNVCESAIDGLSRIAGHGADAIYIRAIGRTGYQAVRAAARAVAAAPPPEAALPALKGALQRLNAEGRDNSRDARAAIIDALEALGQRVQPLKPVRETAITSAIDAGDLYLGASARARITIRGVGAFELALFTPEAPASVARFARLAESGYYNGLTFHRVVSNFVIQGGSPGANEYIGDGAYMRDEVGLWPHVRGAVGISTRGRDTGDAQIFIDLVDNPRLDHDYTVFAQVLNGMDVVDVILEGDVIETIEIVS
jgi:cyclophilin family peptidyl-prolyl cis-trans isomerase